MQPYARLFALVSRADARRLLAMLDVPDATLPRSTRVLWITRPIAVGQDFRVTRINADQFRFDEMVAR